jgi:hypothetical protein
MNRLIKKIKVYHTTSVNNFEKIKSEGFIQPQKGQGAGINYENPTREEISYFSNHVFLCTTLDKAISYVDYYKEENQAIILELEIDEDELLPDQSDCYDCENWIESAEKIQQVCVKGKISTQKISSIYVYDNQTDKYSKIKIIKKTS